MYGWRFHWKRKKKNGFLRWFEVGDLVVQLLSPVKKGGFKGLWFECKLLHCNEGEEMDFLDFVDVRKGIDARRVMR